jgi:hypothetical protein
MHTRLGAVAVKCAVTFPDLFLADHRWLTANHTRGPYCLSIGTLAS